MNNIDRFLRVIYKDSDFFTSDIYFQKITERNAKIS
ncbi:hypothetical protein EDD63_12432 [Breznakia blatticola]|uniref:Uncharacterized protein n=1 Tax=Breznakia blatticola TaxID=1754012 RepID=A0A4R7ZGV2_9FIRM|nr:hypothetical protein EDD63_12432 [Breznakia blatticola]